MDIPAVYLSGPIDGLTFREATGWRNFAADELGDLCQILDPMRDVEVEDPDAPLTASVEDSATVWSCDRAMMTDRGLVARDHHDTCRSTVVVVNLLGAKKRSIGTITEIAWAWHERIPTVVIMEPDGNTHEHPFIRVMTDYRVDSIERAVQVVRSLLGTPPWS
jgi:hypothetical protein